MASMVREKAISPLELVDAHLRQIERVNPAVNAFVEVWAEEARQTARRAEAAVQRGEPLGLLHGVPVTVKDSFDLAGKPTLCGSKLRAGHRAAADSTAAARLRAAGAIILGKTNCAEMLFNYESDNYVSGATRNPWDTARTAGGSSGGEAAAIATLCSPGGIGSDGGGSIRIPAHLCGIAGLKPTPGRVSAAGHFPLIGHPGGLLGVGGPMARSATDLKLLFSVLAGYDSQDPFSAPVPLRPPETAGIRIGLMERFYGVPAAPACLDAVQSGAALLERCGFAVEPFQPEGLERAPNLWWFFFGRVPAPGLRQMIAGREADVHWTLTEFLDKALSEPPVTAESMLSSFAARDRMRAALLRQMEQYPILLTPACSVAAWRPRERRWPIGGKEVSQFEAMMTVTPANLLGLPAVVIPFGKTGDGLPVGVQLIGRPYEEEWILDVAARLEEERGAYAAPPLAGT
jgi:Asp-tRNA(Asn)/Glu-tRNA(Gln) amidotransferase A subunit family amidase